MIKQVVINNYQSHTDSILDFVDGVNVITGSSDSGKSAIMRALLWVFENRPLGDAFKNWKAKDKDNVYVGIQFSEDTALEKERIGTKNQYTITGEESHTLEALKTDVPDEVSEVANLADYNIQTQHNPYFLLQNSAGEVARKLNELIGLDVIDTIFKNLNSSVQSWKNKTSDLSKDIQSLDEQIKGMSFLDEIQAIVDKLNTSVIQQERIESESRGLHSALQDIEELNEEIYTLEIDPELEKEIAVLEEKIKVFQSRKDEYDNLQRVIYNLREINEAIQGEEEWLTIEGAYGVLRDTISVFQNQSKELNSLQTCLTSLKQNSDWIKERETIIEDQIVAQRNLLKKAKVCPVCYSSIDDKAIKRIEGNL